MSKITFDKRTIELLKQKARIKLLEEQVEMLKKLLKENNIGQSMEFKKDDP